MRLRLTKIDELQFLTCLKHQVWGSKARRFRDWQIGDQFVFIVNKSLAALAEVSGTSFDSKQLVWDNGLFPHRIPLKFTYAVLPGQRLPVFGEVRDALTSAWGPMYGFDILNQQVLPEAVAETVVKTIRSCPNGLSAIQQDLDSYIEQARAQREVMSKPQPKRGRPRKTLPELREDEKSGTSIEDRHIQRRSTP